MFKHIKISLPIMNNNEYNIIKLSSLTSAVLPLFLNI